MVRRWRLAGGGTLGMAVALMATAPAVPATAPGLVRIVSPPHGAALDRERPVTVVLRHLGGTRIVGIELNGRPATPRIRRMGPGRLRLTFPAGQGLRTGRNTVTILSRRGRSVDGDAVGVDLARNASGLVTVVAPTRNARLAPGAVRAVVRVPDHRTSVEIRLNGRIVPETGWDERWRAGRIRTQLNASDGLRHGVNILTVTALNGARRQVSRLRFRITGSAPLPAPGRDHLVRPGGTVPLDGRRSLRAPSGTAARQAADDLAYDWRITDAPAGSTAALADPATATPSLTPDVPGSYTVALQVSAGGLTSSAATTTVTARDPGLIPVAVDSDALAITVDGERHLPDPSVTAPALHYVGYDRTTGEVLFEETLPAGSAAAKYTAMLPQAGNDRLIVAAVNPSLQYTPDGAKLVTAVGGLSAVTIPNEARWESQTSGLSGYLVSGTGGDLTFAFGDYRPFTLFSGDTASPANTIVVDGTQYTATLPPTAIAGFQVLQLDPADLSLVSNTTVVTVTPKGVDTAKFAWTLQAPDLRSNLVFIASLGRAQGYTLGTGVIETAGGTPDAINPLQGDDRYGLVYTPPYLDGESPAAQVVEVSSVIDRHSSQRIGLGGVAPPVQISGHLSRRADGLMQPAVGVRGPDTSSADPANPFESFETVVYRPATAWPSTDTPGGLAALAWIGARLGLGDDPRAAYVDAGFVPSDRRVDLAALTYPADQGFTQSEFSLAQGQLMDEFEAVDEVRATLDAVRGTFGAADDLKRYSDIQGTTRAVQQAVTPPPVRSHFNMLRAFGGAALALGKVTSGPTSKALGFVGEVMTVAADLSHSNPGRDPGDLVVNSSDELQTEVANHMVDYLDMLGGIEAAIVSDRGRLMAASAQIGNGNWTWTDQTAAATSEQFTLGIGREAWVSTLGTVYTTYRLNPFHAMKRYPNGGIGCLNSEGAVGFYDRAKPGTIQRWEDGTTDGAARAIARTVGRPGMYVAAPALPDTLRDPLFTAITGASSGGLPPMGFYPPHLATQLPQKTLTCALDPKKSSSYYNGYAANLTDD